MRRYNIILTFAVFLNSITLFSQTAPNIQVMFTEDFKGDTTWSVDNINCELDVSWIHWYNGHLGFGGTFKTSFENFDNHVDSISLDLTNGCAGCFDLILYKSGENPIYVEPPTGNSIQTIVNPWSGNPDSLIMWTYEGGLTVETIYYSVGTSIERIVIKDQENNLIFPNPVKSFFKLKKQINIQKLSIYNAFGLLVMETGPIISEGMIDISFLNDGVYLIEIKNQGSIQYKKLIKASN
ncbi:MAG TPA: T9SS type A sorting domain-containing protein [Lentimicrobium sp.]|nr:T9SS type A sorting domain-containing protein [Lentimicrobium sp.]